MDLTPYLCDRIDAIRLMLILGGIFAGFLALAICSSESSVVHNDKGVFRFVIILFGVFVGCILLLVLLPSKEFLCS